MCIQNRALFNRRILGLVWISSYALDGFQNNDKKYFFLKSKKKLAGFLSFGKSLQYFFNPENSKYNTKNALSP
jgi:hypothetical protein